MQNQKKGNNNLPMLIIGVVLLVGLIGGFWYYSNASATTSVNRTPAANSTPKPAGTPVDAPAGATPPNMTGSPTALVTVEEFADFQCPTCATVHPMVSEIKSIYGNRIKFIFRDFPLNIPAHDKSYEAAVAAEAAGMQGKFWDMQNQLFNNQQAWTANPGYKQIWTDYAQKLGLDVAKFQNDMAGIAAKSRVDEDLKRGKALNVNSTPTIFVNGVSVDVKDFSVAGLKFVIENELQKVAAAQPAAKTGEPTSAANTAAPANSKK